MICASMTPSGGYAAHGCYLTELYAVTVEVKL